MTSGASPNRRAFTLFIEETMSGEAMSVVADERDDFSAVREPQTLHERLAATRARQYAEHWEFDPSHYADTCDRRVTHRAIGNLVDIDGKDRRLLHYLESNVDGERRRTCTASLATIA